MRTSNVFDAGLLMQPAGVTRPALNPISMDQKQAGGWTRQLYSGAKFVTEWAAALVMMVVAGPIIGMLALAVKFTSAGPAFYSQTLLGRNGRQYRMIKLRTMVHDAERGTGPVWAAKGDSRITPVGRILRDTHLDELPQLWNVLCGDMALIGPRPERPEIAAKITARLPEFADRLRVRPGVTGLAQMLLPADDPNDSELTGLRKKLTHDLYYIKNLNPLMDLRIAVSTPCYFLAAAVEAIRHAMLRPCGQAAEQSCEVPPADDACEQVA